MLIGDDSAHPKPLDVPENGGEIAMGDGSLAVAEPLGQGEAYLVRRPGTTSRQAQHRARRSNGPKGALANLLGSELPRRARAILGAPGKSRAACLARGRGST